MLLFLDTINSNAAMLNIMIRRHRHRSGFLAQAGHKLAAVLLEEFHQPSEVNPTVVFLEHAVLAQDDRKGTTKFTHRRDAHLRQNSSFTLCTTSSLV